MHILLRKQGEVAQITLLLSPIVYPVFVSYVDSHSLILGHKY